MKDSILIILQFFQMMTDLRGTDKKQFVEINISCSKRTSKWICDQNLGNWIAILPLMISKSVSDGQNKESIFI